LINLEDIKTLNAQNIEFLLFENCKKVENFFEVAKFKNLKDLEIINCGAIPSISFIKDIPMLKHLKFVKTNVLDGNLFSCLLLDDAHTLAKKHYSHRPDQLPRYGIEK